ncbi:hypothetical protein OEW28_06895 [Defluviimonas sp. WL0002]|uniref:Chitin binding Peritrophin-A domain-containing protein n=1 Tax=Albidovulum marisflavi TaxID=2984159 RepID=A0ABT2ZB96_9RHOB|nr:hypothetical protein [Defluviimonas sp. WL0002]MCV2868353.1 hypothetical protein [Defluviimonas sp. WL0002]
MKTRTFVAALAVIAGMMPALAMAEGCSHDQRSAQVTCAEGMAWDESAQRCIVISS